MGLVCQGGLLVLGGGRLYKVGGCLLAVLVSGLCVVFGLAVCYAWWVCGWRVWCLVVVCGFWGLRFCDFLAVGV